MSAMARLYQYYSYYFGMYSQSNDDTALLLENMDEKHKKEKLKEKLKYDKKVSANIIFEKKLSDLSDNSSTIGSEISDEGDISNMLEEETQKKKIFGKQFAKVLSKDLKALGDGFKKNIIDTSIDSQIDKEAEESIKKKEEELSKIYKTTREKSNMKINFEMKETMLEFPLDDTKSTTKVLRLKSNITGNVYLKTNVDLIRDGNSKLVKVNFRENNFKAGIKIYN